MVKEPNYTQIPNEFLDDRMASLSYWGFKVLMAISRKTFGFHKTEDHISFSQLRDMTGIPSNDTLYKAIDELSGDVEKYVSDGKTFYRILFENDMEDHYTVRNGNNNVVTPGVTQSVTPGVNTKETVKETTKETSAPTDQNRSVQKPVTYSFTTGLFSGVSDEMVATWQAMCPAINVDREIIKAAQWLLANPAKRKKNYRKFLVNWMLRGQERGKG